MDGAHEPVVPEAGSRVATACKGMIRLEPHTPTTVYRGRRLYFCLPDCLENFQRDPQSSCLVGDPLLEEASNGTNEPA